MQVTINLGGGEIILVSEKPVNNLKWHHVHVQRNMEQVLLRVDSEPAMVTYGPSGSTQLDTEPIIYLGVPKAEPKDLIKDALDSFVGCIKEFKFNSHFVNLPVSEDSQRSCG
ncbi:contactin-associated protein-like 5 [Symsagittifera roscoffensis]